MKRRLIGSIGLACIVLALAACQPAATSWKEIPPAADGIELPYSKAPVVLVERLRGRLAERKLVEVANRVERLAPGVGWEKHVAWRDTHDGLLLLRAERVPEPDAPVQIAEFSRSGRILFVIGTVDETGEQLVVLTALAKPA
jgi:hypothetical protein